MSPRRDKRDTPPPPPLSVPTTAIRVAKWGGSVALVAAAAMSVQTLYSLGRILGYAKWNAWLLPASLDVYAATAIWVGHRIPAEHKARATARTNARTALLLTVGANGLFHLLNLPNVHLPNWISVTLLVVVSALPPFVVERILHLQMSVSTGHAEVAAAKPEAANVKPANDNPAVAAKTEPTTPIANPVVPPIAAANDNPAPIDNRQNDKAAAAKPKPAAKTAGGDNANEALAAAMLPIYRQMLEATGKRPSAPDLLKAVPELKDYSPSRAKQIREIVETRWHPEMMPKFRVIEGGEDLQQVS